MTHQPVDPPTLGSPLPPRRTTATVLASVSAVAILVAMVSWSSPRAAASPPTVDAATNVTFGTILTDAAGFTLYTFPSDHKGISNCTGPCVPVWPALTVPGGTSPTAGPGLTGTLGAVQQPNTTFQVIYNGSPLYTFVGDTAPGQVIGNGIGGFLVAQMPTITSGASTSVATASSFTFPVTTSGSPAAKVKEKGKLPKGVSFHKGTGSATIAGTPTSTKHKLAAGTYPLTIIATFGKGGTKDVVTQAFTLIVTP